MINIYTKYELLKSKLGICNHISFDLSINNDLSMYGIVLNILVFLLVAKMTSRHNESTDEIKDRLHFPQ